MPFTPILPFSKPPTPRMDISPPEPGCSPPKPAKLPIDDCKYRKRPIFWRLHNLKALSPFCVVVMFLKEIETWPAEGMTKIAFKKLRHDGEVIPEILHLFRFKRSMTDHLVRFTEEVMRGPS